LDHAPLLRRGRPLKRWRYVGVYGPELMLCGGDLRVGPLRRRFWALADPGGGLRERGALLGSAGVGVEPRGLRIRARGVKAAIEIGEGTPVDVVSRHGGGPIWTRKRAGVPARGSVAIDGHERRVDAAAVVDESAGYHARHTAWRWSAGVGRTDDGGAVAWNLVAGIHDGPTGSESAIWREGEPREVGPVEFAADLSSVAFAEGGALRFSPWSSLEHRTNALVVRSRYRQPFGTFAGELPGGLRLAEGYGVMEEHDVSW
jgi:hypothetical protein